MKRFKIEISPTIIYIYICDDDNVVEIRIILDKDNTLKIKLYFNF